MFRLSFRAQFIPDPLASKFANVSGCVAQIVVCRLSSSAEIPAAILLVTIPSVRMNQNDG